MNKNRSSGDNKYGVVATKNLGKGRERSLGENSFYKKFSLSRAAWFDGKAALGFSCESRDAWCERLISNRVFIF
ncbi:MAG: hypothetical protein Q4E67_04740 [Planctomycetia bacterium]|nr:hypothetical protein [Planctomycetia bacterium]